MAADAMMFANEALFNLLLSRYSAANPAAFTADTRDYQLGIEFAIYLNGPPTTDLAAQAGGGNVGIHFPLVLRVFDIHGGQHKLQKTVLANVLVSGTLGLRGQSLGLTGLTASGTHDTLDRKVADKFNDLVLPTLQSAVANMPLPDLTRVIGVAVQVVNVQIVNHQVAVSARIAGGSGQLALAVPVPDFPAVTVAIAGDAINALARAEFQPVTARAPGAHESSAGFGYDAQAEAGASNPRVSIVGARAEGTIDVWATAKAGVEAAGEWVEPDVRVTARVPPLGLRLVTDGEGKNLDVQVYMDGLVFFDFGLPSLLEKYADQILAALGPLGLILTQAINRGLASISLRAFALPATVPGTTLAADLTFAQTMFADNAAVAVVRVG